MSHALQTPIAKQHARIGKNSRDKNSQDKNSRDKSNRNKNANLGKTANRVAIIAMMMVQTLSASAILCQVS